MQPEASGDMENERGDFIARTSCGAEGFRCCWAKPSWLAGFQGLDWAPPQPGLQVNPVHTKFSMPARKTRFEGAGSEETSGKRKGAYGLMQGTGFSSERQTERV